MHYLNCDVFPSSSTITLHCISIVIPQLLSSLPSGQSKPPSQTWQLVMQEPSDVQRNWLFEQSKRNASYHHQPFIYKHTRQCFVISSTDQITQTNCLCRKHYFVEHNCHAQVLMFSGRLRTRLWWICKKLCFGLRKMCGRVLSAPQLILSSSYTLTLAFNYLPLREHCELVKNISLIHVLTPVTVTRQKYVGFEHTTWSGQRRSELDMQCKRTVRQMVRLYLIFHVATNLNCILSWTQSMFL